MRYRKANPKLAGKLREGQRIFIRKDGKLQPVKVRYIVSSPQFSSYIHISYIPLRASEKRKWEKKPWMMHSFDSKYAKVYLAVPDRNPAPTFSSRETATPQEKAKLCEQWDRLTARDFRLILRSARR